MVRPKFTSACVVGSDEKLDARGDRMKTQPVLTRNEKTRPAEFPNKTIGLQSAKPCVRHRRRCEKYATWLREEAMKCIDQWSDE